MWVPLPMGSAALRAETGAAAVRPFPSGRTDRAKP